MSNVWQWWQDALAGKSPAIDANTPQCGFYKKREGKGGKWLPVMIRFDDNGALRCRVGDDSAADPFDEWTWCAGNPVSKEAAKVAFETGFFPGDVGLAPAIGDNSANLGPLELLRDYLETARAWFKGKTINTQILCDEAANYATEITKLRSAADKERDSKVRPHLDAQREINGQYKPAIEDADELAKAIKRASDGYLIAEKTRLEAEQRKRYAEEQARIAAERKRIEDERAELMKADPIAALTSPEPELPMAPPPPAPVKVQAGGQRGKKMSLRTYTIHEVTDYAKALDWASMHPEVVAVVEKVAKAAAREGQKVPGVTTRTEERAA